MGELNSEQEALAWRAIQEPSFQGIIWVRPDGTIARANSQLYAILGTSPAELRDRAWLDFVHHPHRQREKMNEAILAAGGMAYQAQLTIEKENGKLIHVLLIGKAVFSSQGALVMHIKEVMEALPPCSPALKKPRIVSILRKWKEAIFLTMAIALGIAGYLAKLFPALPLL